MLAISEKKGSGGDENDADDNCANEALTNRFWESESGTQARSVKGRLSACYNFCHRTYFKHS